MTDMDNLYSGDIKERERVARMYRVFPQQRVKLPSEFRRHWKELLGGRRISDGEVWPDYIAKLSRMSKWPEHAFGTANAACLVVWHRPGASASGNPPPGAYIGPKIPVLGGIPHAHNVFWAGLHPNRSWHFLHEYLPQAFNELDDPWSQVMIACLNPEPGADGDIDRDANMAAVQKGGSIDKIVAVCKPKVILACGKTSVHPALASWNNSGNIKVIYKNHPSARGTSAWNYNAYGLGIVEELRMALYEN